MQISFKYNLENRPPNDLKLIIHADVKPPNEPRGRYNAPVVDEVAVLMIDEDKGPRDIVLTARDGRLLQFIDLMTRFNIPYCFPLETTDTVLIFHSRILRLHLKLFHVCSFMHLDSWIPQIYE
nr:uncharacterized protein LOC118682310 isoform X2 [Bactrocera oleae]XP_036226590.1 uncharacterized protein LOC118682310 isoform X2 [Bactrocera oleae]